MSRRRLVLQSALVIAAGASWTGAGAQAFPSRPIQLYVAFAPGGAGDIVARLVAREMGRSLGQAVVIENRPVPGVAVSTVAKAKPDGHTLMVAGNGTALSQVLFKKLPHDVMKDFTHVSTMAFFDLVLVTGSDSPFNSVADLVRHARANSGKLNIGSARLGSTQNLCAELFKSMAGIDAVIVPYKTTSEILTGLRSRDIHVAFEILPPVLAQISARSIKPLAVTSGLRFAGLPQVPTLGESIAGFEVASWNGISAPAGTPRAVIERLNDAVRAALGSPEVQRQLQAVGMVARSSTPEQMAQRMRDDIVKWDAVIDKAGIERQ